MNKIVELSSLVAGYNEEVILNDVNLVIRENDFLGIIGPNGGGKTTLLKVMMGLIRPFAGEVILHQGNTHRGFFGYLPQVNQIDKKFPITVMDVVLSGLMHEGSRLGRFSREDRNKAEALLERSGMHIMKNAILGELSGGQMQRVLLARAIISSPQLLVLDEPDTFVDNNFENDLYNFLKELNSEMAIMMVSHDLGMISSYVKTIACVNRGLHYHATNQITDEVLASYNCPIDLIAHGKLPHRILKEHKHESES